MIAIAGATGAVGSSLARRVRASGRTPWLIGRSEEKLEKLASEVGGIFTTVDLSTPESISQKLLAAPTNGGQSLPLNGFAYCAGSIVLKPLKRTAPDDFRKAFDVNVLSALECIRCLEQQLRASKGSVVLFSTVAVQKGFTNHAVISAAKGAIEGATRALAAEMAPAVRVNAIAPSISRSGMAAPMLGKEAMAASLAKMHPLARTGEPDDSAALAAYLLSDEASWMTGQVIGIDGGRAAIA